MLLTLLTSACSTVPTVDDHFITRPPENLLIECSPFKKIEKDDSNYLQQFLIDIKAQYNDCRDRHSALIESIK